MHISKISNTVENFIKRYIGRVEFRKIFACIANKLNISYNN